MTLETAPQPSAKRCICVINNLDGKIVGSWTGDLYDIEGELNLLKKFASSQEVRFQDFGAEGPDNARWAYPELFLPREMPTAQEGQKELEWRREQIARLEERLQGASGR